LQDFSHVRKSADIYLRAGRQSSKPGAQNATAPGSTALASHIKPNKPGRRPDPIILLSPSASSLLRMSNIKSFLGDGSYTQPDNASATTSILHISRMIPSIDPNRPLRFILVDSPDQFKPDYWDRVVAVFTTGQAWQFKSYKWQTPQELFNKVLGIFVGWRGETVPQAVNGWGRGVTKVEIDPWRGNSTGRWRDREVVESLWGKIEEQMRKNGWGSGGPTVRA
jgi:parafibromin